MRIPCPYCGPRDARRVHLSRRRARLQRPDPARPTRASAFYDYVYLRDNPAGPHRELWHHVRRLPRLAGRRRATRAPTRSWRAALATTRRRTEPADAIGGSELTRASASPRGGLDRPLAHAVASPSTAQPIAAIAGDTLASALLANGVRLVGRSFKYHRPRGILTRGLRGAERAGRAAQRRAARAQHARDRRPSSIDGLARRQPEPLAVAALRPAGGQLAARAASRAPASTTRPSCGRRRSGRRSTSR